jgi:hypothetical protein
MKFETVQTKQNKEEVGTVTFDKVNIADLGQKKDEYRRVPVPRNRITPLKQQWDSILKTLVEHMKLQVRMNTKRRAVELKVRIILLTVNFRPVKPQLTSVRFRRLPTFLKLLC